MGVFWGEGFDAAAALGLAGGGVEEEALADEPDPAGGVMADRGWDAAGFAGGGQDEEVVQDAGFGDGAEGEFEFAPGFFRAGEDLDVVGDDEEALGLGAAVAVGDGVGEVAEGVGGAGEGFGAEVVDAVERGEGVELVAFAVEQVDLVEVGQTQEVGE